MSVCDVIEVNNEVYVHISKVEDLGKLKTENDRLHKLISQREKKWEKWTTEKQILSSKMSDYLCKYQNLKREYTKQIKISTDRKKEIERLNNIIKRFEEDLREVYLTFGEFSEEYTENCIKKLKEELKYTIPIVEHNKTITKHLKEIERLNNIINKIEEHFVFLKMNSTGGNKEFFEDILDFIKALRELKGSESNE